MLYPSKEATQVDIVPLDGRRHSARVQEAELRQFPAGATVTIADPATCNCKENEGWQAYEPYGKDMILVVVSSQPLIRLPRPEKEKPADYLRDVQAALRDAMRRDLRVSARAILIETEKP